VSIPPWVETASKVWRSQSERVERQITKVASRENRLTHKRKSREDVEGSHDGRWVLEGSFLVELPHLWERISDRKKNKGKGEPLETSTGKSSSSPPSSFLRLFAHLALGFREKEVGF